MTDAIRQLSRYSMPVVGRGWLHTAMGLGGFEVEEIAKPLKQNISLMMVDQWTPEGVMQAVEHTKQYGAFKVLNTIGFKMGEIDPEKRETKEESVTAATLGHLFGEGFFSRKEVATFVKMPVEEKLVFLKEKIEKKLEPVEQDVEKFIRKTNPNKGITGAVNRLLGYLPHNREPSISPAEFSAEIDKIDPHLRKLFEATGIDVVVSSEDKKSIKGKTIASSILGASRVLFSYNTYSFQNPHAVEEELVHTADELIGAIHPEFKDVGRFTLDPVFNRAIFQDVAYEKGSQGDIDATLPEAEQARILTARKILYNMGKTSPIFYKGDDFNLEMLPAIREVVAKIDAGEITIQDYRGGNLGHAVVDVVVEGPASKYFPSLLGERDIKMNDGTVVAKQNQIDRFNEACIKVTEIALSAGKKAEISRIDTPELKVPPQPAREHTLQNTNGGKAVAEPEKDIRQGVQ